MLINSKTNNNAEYPILCSECGEFYRNLYLKGRVKDVKHYLSSGGFDYIIIDYDTLKFNNNEECYLVKIDKENNNIILDVSRKFTSVMSIVI